MDYFLLFGLIGFACCIFGFIGYATITNKIIKDQEREIAKLETENRRLKSALRGVKSINYLYLSNKPLDYPPTARIALKTRDNSKEY